jgi:ABC-type uncharacterized transport system substrate-binding protein
MQRREVIALLGGLGVALPALAARGEVPTRPAMIGMLLLGSKVATQPRLSGFPQGMQELGYVQGQHYITEGRYADGDVARLPTLFQELLQLKPDVILTGTTAGILELKHKATTVPVVGASLTDPVSFGLAASLERPGGQVTGILIASDNLAAKQVELALEILPGAKQIGILMHAGNQSSTVHRQHLEAATKTLALKLVAGEAHGPTDFDSAFRTLVDEHVHLVVVPPDGLFVSERQTIVKLAAAMRLPVLYPYREFVEAGGLLSYGVDLRDSWRRAASFVDKILKGATPADLPIEQPTNELMVNLKAADALALTIPPNVLARATQVIQ